MIEYPAFLPCPTWEYGQGMTAFAGRTPMESGWVRQRRRWFDIHVSIDLSFKMSVATYAIWQKWANQNGYSWFRIPLDKFFDEQKLTDIRFTTPVQFTYDDWGDLVITVSAEVYNGKVNPDPIPPWNGNTPIECRPYNCSSYADWLVEIGQLENYTGGLALNVVNDHASTPYPFSEVTFPGDGKWLYINNYIAAPSVITGYASGGPNTNLISTDDVTAYLGLNGPQLCDGDIARMGAVNASKGLGVKCAVQPGTRVDGGAAAWGDWGMEAAIMDLELGRAPISMSGGLMRGSGKPWTYVFRGTTFYQEDPGPIGISITTTDGLTGDVQVSLYINNTYTNLIPNQGATFDVPGGAARLNMFSGRIGSSSPYQDQLSDGKWYVVRDVEVIASYGGKSAGLSGRQVYGWMQAPIDTEGSFDGVAPYYPGGNRWLYAYGVAFYNFSGNFASFMGGPASEDHSTEAYWNWEQNFSSYTPPDYCG